jgi:hypothetical protein
MEEKIALWLFMLVSFICLLTGLLEYRSHSDEPFGFPMTATGFKVRDVRAWNRRVAALWLIAGVCLLADTFIFKLTKKYLLCALLVILIFTLVTLYYLKKLIPSYMVLPDDEELWKDVKKK